MTEDNGSVGVLVQLDVAKLQATPEDQQHIYLMSFMRDLERLVEKLDADGASSHQLYVQKEVFKVLRLNTPAPTKLIRTLAGRCLSLIFEKGDRKLLFDTINELLNMLNSSKNEKDLKGMMATLHCLGEVYEAAGDSASQLCTLTVSTALKVLKPASSHCGLRAIVYQALGKIAGTVAQSMDEGTAKDIYKSSRTAAASDKSVIVQVAALQVYSHFLRI